MWRARHTTTAFGLRIGVRADRSGFLDALLTALPPVTRPSPSSRLDRLYSVRSSRRGPGGAGPAIEVWADGERVIRTGHLPEARLAFEEDVQMYLAQWAHDRIFVHAGVVARGGLAIIAPGRSFWGKSTLVRELLAAGATYYSDEYAVLDTNGRVHPYPRPLQLRRPGQRRGSRRTPESLGAEVGCEPLPVGLVVHTRYHPEGRWRPRPLSRGETMLTLLHNAIPARSRPALTMRVLRQVATKPGLTAVEGERGEAAACALDLLERLSLAGRSPTVTSKLTRSG